MATVSIGVMAYNEEGNIGRLLQSLRRQQVSSAELKEIIVVSSGCTDRTEEIAREIMEQDDRLKLIVQPQREGKAAAINLFLARASGDILVMESGDTVPDEGTIEKLVAPFSDPRVGMTGAHPIPSNSQETFLGYTVNLLWNLHHQIAMETPKLGELVAFRNFVKEIPRDTAVDEASIEAIVRDAGYELRYVSDALVRNKGAENTGDFIKQRRRIAAGHKHLLRVNKYEVSTMSGKKILRMLLREQEWRPRKALWTCGAIILEVTGRFLGYYDFYVKKKNPFIWDIASSTKKWD